MRNKPEEIWVNKLALGYHSSTSILLVHDNESAVHPEDHKFIEKSAYDEAIKELKRAYSWLHPSKGMDIGIGKTLRKLGKL